MNFYKTVVKAIAQICRERRDEASEIRYGSGYPQDKIEKEIAELNVTYLEKIDDMLYDAAEIVQRANKENFLFE